MAMAHWTAKDFVEVSRANVVEGYPANRYGYCRKCFGDMQNLYGKGFTHYNSHQYAKRMGLWGKQR